MTNFKDKANFLWSIADLLRGHYKQADYGKVILPFTVLRRLDLVLTPTKQAVKEAYEKHKDKKPEILEPLLNNAAKAKFHNRSKYDFSELVAGDTTNIAANLRNYINGFSAKEIIDYFSFDDQIKKLEEYDLLYLVMKKFDEAGELLKNVNSLEMGYIFEELIRKFAELSNETAGEHFTPREVIRLMVNLLFVNDKEILRKQGIVKTLYDPACGTGGMLSIAEEYLQELNPDAKLEVFGQELNPESYAICKSDMLIKGQNPANIKFGNTFTQDGLSQVQFDYMLSNPPFGVDWKKAEKQIKDEYTNRGHSGRFGAGLPAISDGSFLFLQHMISKMKHNTEGGSRIGIVFNGSPLFSGGADSGASNIRRWIIENDWLEAIIAMPDQLFYNTGISTYVWILTDRKNAKRRGKVQLINATGAKYEDKDNPFYAKMLRSLGNKRKEIHEQGIQTITQIYAAFEESEFCKIFDNEDFGYQRICIERPKRDTEGVVLKDKKDNVIADSDLRDFENVPLKQDINTYFEREVLPHVPDAWIDETKTKIGYEINFTKYFYEYKPLRALADIRTEILALEAETDGLIKNVLN
jgi:type I restriction enzyme M protein